MSIDEYFDALSQNRDNIREFPPYAELIPRVDELYHRTIGLVPNERTASVQGRFLLVCHKSYLTAANLIAQAQPEDAGPVTRRAIEIVRLAAAFKDDESVLNQWNSWETRMRRWEARRNESKPEPLHIKIEVKHPIVEELMATWGILSDTDVHFTPEHFMSLGWTRRGDEVFLSYFEQDMDVIKREIVALTGTHGRILQVFDWCFDGIFFKSEEYERLRHELHRAGKVYADEFL